MNNNICTKCIMDTSVPDIEFDENGVCNYCKLQDELEKQYPINAEGEDQLKGIIEKIKSNGKSKKYDCIIGVSGGTDSTYFLLMAKKYGLRPLAVHFDNGWNTEISVRNIENAISRLNIDLITYVVDWEEFKDIQLSFLKASVPEVELPTDLAVRTVLYKIAAAEKIKYIIEATSFRAEGIVPHGWGYKDGKYIKSVQKKFGKYPIKSFPNLSIFKYLYYAGIRRIELLRLLNFISYQKKDAKEIIKKELGWQDYGEHHHESIYTKFFQAYLAPKKFNMDRRKVTLSAMIRCKKISRDEALNKIQKDYYNEEELLQDMEYISKKFNLTLDEFKKIINQNPKSFLDYPSYYPLLKRINFLVKVAYKFKLLKSGFQRGKLSV